MKVLNLRKYITKIQYRSISFDTKSLFICLETVAEYLKEVI